MTKGEPLVSVIVPVYNMDAFLRETLDSILSSDYSNFEVVIMDDGSTDNSLKIAQEYAFKDKRVRAYTQSNAGACAARNHAISLAQGEYILPVDSDNTITPQFIFNAVKIISSDLDIKVVCPRADFFGDRTGEWILPTFSLSLIAHKNIMDTCAMYRKADWERVGGYCEDIIAREDWEFWISILKDGGKVVKLPEISLHYRVRKNSKRVSDRKLKRHVIDILNIRHPEFFERELGGPLRYHRSWSRLINKFYRLFNHRIFVINENYSHLDTFIKVMPMLFNNGYGKIIYKGRNELREMNLNGVDLVVKSYCIPNIINRIVYGIFRSSKAERSYHYAHMLRANGIGSPTPVAYYTERKGLFFSRSFFISLKSECQYTYIDLIKHEFSNAENIVKAIARVAAQMHEKGFLHKDFSRGNILFRETPAGVMVEIIDLNRIRFRKIGINEGCKNFERLPATPQIHRWLAEEYSMVRGFDTEECYKLIASYRNAQPDVILPIK